MRLFILFSIVCAMLAPAMQSEDPAPPPALVVPLRIIEIERPDGILVLRPQADATKCADSGAWQTCDDVTFTAAFVPHSPTPEEGAEVLRAAR